MFEKLKKDILKKEREKAIAILKNSDPNRIKQYGESLLIPAFKRAAMLVPAYKQILGESNVDVSSIKTISDFQKNVPIIDKEKTFGRFQLEELCLYGNLDMSVLFMTSSGYSGVFSYGIVTEGSEERVAQSIDTALSFGFHSDNKKTFILNALPMGVKFKSCHPLANTSVRTDMVFSFIKNLCSKFDQMIIVSDPHFIKKIIEEGVEIGIDWRAHNISFILGEDWFSNSFMEYLMHQINYNMESPKNEILTTMGVTELDLNMFHDSDHIRSIRSIVQQDPNMMKELFGPGIRACPELMYYYPTRTFLELADCDGDGFGNLVFSMLSKELKIPFFRYNSKDNAKLFSYNEIKNILAKYGYEKYAPELKLPIAAIFGRRDNRIQTKKGIITPEDIKEALYRDFEIAGSVTGYFRLSLKNNKPLLEIQLKEKVKNSPALKNKIEKLVCGFLEQKVQIKVYLYRDFPYGMTLDYERKFKTM